MSDDRMGRSPSLQTVEGGTSFHALTDWIMAVLILGAAVASIAYPVLYLQVSFVLDPHSPDFSPAVFVPLFLSVFGLKHLVSAVHSTLLGRKFGQSVMEIEGGAVAPGQTVKGLIRSPVHLEPLGDYEIRLRCVQRRIISRQSGPRHQDHIREEQTLNVSAQAADPRKGIPFAFMIPAGALSTTVPRTNVLDLVGGPGEEVRWIIEIKAPLKGLNYYAIFGVHVSPNSSRPAISASRKPPPLSLDMFENRLQKLGPSRLGPDRMKLTPTDGISVMVEFYRDQRADGHEGVGRDVLRFSWGIHEEKGVDDFQLAIARWLSLDPSSPYGDHWKMTLTFHYAPVDDLRALGKGYDTCRGLDDIRRFEKSVRRSKAMKAVGAVAARKVSLGYRA